MVRSSLNRTEDGWDPHLIAWRVTPSGDSALWTAFIQSIAQMCIVSTRFTNEGLRLYDLQESGFLIPQITQYIIRSREINLRFLCPILLYQCVDHQHQSFFHLDSDCRQRKFSQQDFQAVRLCCIKGRTFSCQSSNTFSLLACPKYSVDAVSNGVPQNGQPLYRSKGNVLSGITCPQGSFTPFLLLNILASHVIQWSKRVSPVGVSQPFTNGAQLSKCYPHL